MDGWRKEAVNPERLAETNNANWEQICAKE